jgi:hypothetical protein
MYQPFDDRGGVFSSVIYRPTRGIAPGAPIGGCDPPHPASIAAATQLLSA